MIKAAFFATTPANIDRVYGQGRRQQVAARTELYPEIITEKNFDEHLGRLRDIEAVFSTWMMPELTARRLDGLPCLKAVFYAAGTTKFFAPKLLPRGIRFMSAWVVNGIPVAEFTVSEILLAGKGYYRNLRESKTYEFRVAGPFMGRGNFGIDVGVIGLGAVGRKVVEMLGAHAVNTLVYDPFVKEEAARELGVELVTLDEMFRRCYVVTNHAPDFDSTKGMLPGELFASMPRDATFINNGRGATVRESEFIDVLRSRPDLTALLDVTYPEPPEKGSPFYELPNVYLTSHLAGSSGDEVIRMADCCIEAFDEWQASGNLPYEIDEKLFVTLA
jgi:phosphoglycerate dehydrogenase-like enzyme